jgi:hypothetical protein
VILSQVKGIGAFVINFEGSKRIFNTGINKAKVANAKNTPITLNRIFNNACPL